MPIATKFDMKRDLNPFYAPPTYPVLVEVAQLRYLRIDGVIPEGGSGPGADQGVRGGGRRPLWRGLHPEVRAGTSS